MNPKIKVLSLEDKIEAINEIKIELHKIESTVHYPTEIEEALIPKAFYNALNNCIQQSDEQMGVSRT